MTSLPSRRQLLAAALLSCTTGAFAQAAAPVRVASKIDTEGSLLGQLILQVLEANGIKTQNRLQLGGTKILRGALVAGEVDIYPEYTGNAPSFLLMKRTRPGKTRRPGTRR